MWNTSVARALTVMRSSAACIHPHGTYRRWRGVEGLVFEERARDFSPQTRGRSHRLQPRAAATLWRTRSALTVDRGSAASQVLPEEEIIEDPSRAAQRFKGRSRYEGWSGEDDTDSSRADQTWTLFVLTEEFVSPDPGGERVFFGFNRFHSRTNLSAK